MSGSTKRQRKVFVSHIAEEGPLSRVLKEWIGSAVGIDRVFASTHDIDLGEQWLDQINEALSAADALVVLCSPGSMQRPWVNFEAGGGWGKELPVVPVCHSGMTKGQLPHPLAIFQGIDLDSPSACRQLVVRLARRLEVSEPEDLSYDDMMGDVQSALDAIARTNPFGGPRLSPPEQGRSGILVDVSHGQAKWRGESTVGSIFDLCRGKLPSLVSPGEEPTWNLQLLSDARSLWWPDLEPWRGLIVGAPWRATMEEPARSQIAGWVRAGGRLLLLGFELGDRHHGGNLNTLAHEFGLHFNADIVAPAGYTGRKPYGVPVDFVAEATEHPVMSSVRNLRLENVQTLAVDPGGQELLRLGSNRIARPSREAVDYQDGGMLTPRSEIEFSEPAPWVPVAAEAPHGLTGRGRVLALGTWDLFGRAGDHLRSGDTGVFVRNLLNWLAGEI
jgi:hypothetical protein